MSNSRGNLNSPWFAWWILRTCLMSAIAALLFSIALSNDALQAPTISVNLALAGAIILYVEGWSWWNRIVSRRNSQAPPP